MFHLAIFGFPGSNLRIFPQMCIQASPELTNFTNLTNLQAPLTMSFSFFWGGGIGRLFWVTMGRSQLPNKLFSSHQLTKLLKQRMPSHTEYVRSQYNCENLHSHKLKTCKPFPTHKGILQLQWTLSSCSQYSCENLHFYELKSEYSGKNLHSYQLKTCEQFPTHEGIK